MKFTYDYFQKLLAYNLDLNLFYCDKEYYVRYKKDSWRFTEANSLDFQTFNDCNEFVETAQINGKLLSEIWDDVIISKGYDR